MKRKFASLLLVLMLCMSVFTGCSLVTTNSQNYYDAIVATISYKDGTQDDITKRELILAYSSYGSNYGSGEDSYKQTLQNVIDQKLTAKAVKEYYAENGEEFLNDNENTYLWDQTYESVYSIFYEYYNDAESGDDSSDSSSSGTVYTPYEKTVYLDKVETTTKYYNKNGKLEDDNGKYDLVTNSNYVLKKNEKASTTRGSYEARKYTFTYEDGAYTSFTQVDSSAEGTYLDFEYVDEDTGLAAFQEMMYQKVLNNFTDAESQTAWKVAFGKYITTIKNNYSYKTFKNDKECFMFELDRVYQIVKANYVITKYSDVYDSTSFDGADSTNVSVSDILKYYSAKVRSDYEKYAVDGDTSTYATNMLSSISDVNYYLEGEGASKYFYLGYIKLEMTDDQQTELSNLKSALKARSISKSQYDLKVDALYDSIKGYKRDDNGEKTSTQIGSKELETLLKEKVADIKYSNEEFVSEESNGESEDSFNAHKADYNKAKSYEKADIFRDYMFDYSDDDTLKNAEYASVFGVDASGNVLASDTFSENTDITGAIKALYNDGNAAVGDMTSFVRADDGLYLFFYAGEISNLFNGINEKFDISNNQENILTLASTRLSIFSEKTILDDIYADLENTSAYTAFETLSKNYNRVKFVETCTIYEDRIKDLYE